MYDLTLSSHISIDFFQTFLLESHVLFNPTFFIDSKNVPSVCASVPLREQCKWLHKFSLREQIGHSAALMLVHFSDALLLFTLESLSRKKKNPIKPPRLLVAGSFFLRESTIRQGSANVFECCLTRFTLFLIFCSPWGKLGAIRNVLRGKES